MNREDNKRVMGLRLHRRYVEHCGAQSGRSVFVSCDSLQLETFIGHRQTWEHQYTRPSGSDHRHTYPRSGHRCRCRGPSERSLLVASVVRPTRFGLGPIKPGLFQPDCRKKKKNEKRNCLANSNEQNFEECGGRPGREGGCVESRGAGPESQSFSPEFS